MATLHSGSLQRWLLSLPPVEYALQQVRELLIGSLKCGPIPQHIAFIMDGNRRWARTHHVETVEGHHMGFEALAKVLEVCYKSGVEYVTIYAFSIENFKRSKYEVDGLMDMAKTKLVQMSQHGELFDRYGAAVRILGDRSLVRDDVLEQVDKAVEMTKDNGSAVLNVCFPYTGREEIVHSIRETVKDYSSAPPEKRKEKRPFSETHIQRNIRKGSQLESLAEEQEMPAEPPVAETASMPSSDAENTSVSEQDLDSSSHLAHPPSSQTSLSPSPDLQPSSRLDLYAQKKSSSRSKSPHLPDPENISAETLTRNTYINCPPPELLIRTSGVNRLSDFMLWQVHENTECKFIDCLWPEFNLWKFLPALVEWQWSQKKAMNGNGGERAKAA
ncbi:cis-prenyltransferase [Saxophila tyrrhenica]|uniref:Alkyl transferase n=1 Tax=Saxophila tyrrhenica TaxID=1690608 RepID=A0AAV9PLS3_9PEZI|nr:cis-prenyltransferase [Saxophila tyrrhenica]